MKKNKLTFMVVLLLTLFIMILGFLIFIYFYNMKFASSYTKENEKDFIPKVSKMGIDLYSNYYYKSVSKDYNTKEEFYDFLKKFEDIGLKFDLEQIYEYKEENKKEIDDFLKYKTKCKKSDILMVIYPKSPYSEKDFNSEVIMDCDKEESISKDKNK